MNAAGDAMDLIETYLHAVALLLPRAQREDITAELRDTILTRVEAREAELGRKLTPDEVEQVLREIGHPLLVAARYREGPQHLIGPALYPYWAFAVKAVLTVMAAVGALLFLARLVGTGDAAFALGRAIATFVGGTLTLVGFATILGWIVERRGGRIGYLEHWRVADLKGLEFLAWDLDTLREHFAGPGAAPGWTGPSGGPRPWSAAAPGASQRRESPPPPAAERWSGTWPGASPQPWSSAAPDRSQRQWERRWDREAHRIRREAARSSTAGRAIGAMAVGAVILLWWIGLVPFGLVGSPQEVRQLGFEPGPLASVDWRAVRDMLFWPVLAYGVAVFVQGVVIWTHPRAVRLHGLVNLAIAGAVLLCVAWMWTDSPLSPALHVDSLAGLALQLRDALRQPPPKPVAPFLALILLVVAFGALCRGLHGLFQLVLGAPAEPPAERPPAS